MEDLINLYKEKKTETLKLLADLYLDKMDGARGLNSEIRKLERSVKDFQLKIENLQKTAGRPDPTNQISIFVITNTNDKIKTALGEELYTTLTPPNHDDIECGHWKPFVNESYTIKDLMADLKEKRGYKFTEYYFDEQKKDDFIFMMEESMGSHIAIIDLLSLNNENEQVVSRFDRKMTYLVVTPICTHLPEKLKEYMKEKRKKIFSFLERSYELTLCDFYQPENSGRLSFLQILTTFLKKKQGQYKYIKDQVSVDDNNLRTEVYNPSF